MILGIGTDRVSSASTRLPPIPCKSVVPKHHSQPANCSVATYLESKTQSSVQQQPSDLVFSRTEAAVLFQKVHLTPFTSSKLVHCVLLFCYFVKSMSADILSEVCKKYRKSLYHGVFSQQDTHVNRAEIQLLFEILYNYRIHQEIISQSSVISAFPPLKYNTVLGEKGVYVLGNQTKKVTIILLIQLRVVFSFCLHFCFGLISIQVVSLILSYSEELKPWEGKCLKSKLKCNQM